MATTNRSTAERTAEIDLAAETGAASPNEIAAAAPQPQSDPDATLVQLQQFGFSGERIVVSFPKTGDDERSSFFVGAAGYTAQVPFDTPVELPIEVVIHLDTCVETHYVSDHANNVIERKRKRYPYTRV